MSTSLDFKYHRDKFIDDAIKTPGISTPLPLVTISSTASTDIDGRILGTEYNINLDGYVISKIVDPASAGDGPGSHALISAGSEIENFFKDSKKQGSVFKILCDDSSESAASESSESLIISGVFFKNFEFSQGEDQWTRIVPYSVSLQGFNRGSGIYAGYSIASFDDTWSIEQLSDTSLYKFKVKPPHYDFKSQGSNPSLEDIPSQGDLNIQEDQEFSETNLLQYRVTHRVGAVGKSINILDPDNPEASDSATPGYQLAADFVNDRVNSSDYSGAAAAEDENINRVYFPFRNTYDDGKGRLFLYNHVRTIDSNIGAASYSVVDTWLALNSGVEYTEDTTWEINTDEQKVRTVNLQGTVRGLEHFRDDAKHDQGAAETNGIYTSLIDGSLTGLISANNDPKNNLESATAIGTTKLENALKGYVSGVKPYLYRRASMANSAIPAGVSAAGSATTFESDEVFIGKQGAPLNINPLNYTESINAREGSINYNVSYSNKGGAFFSGVISSNMTITDLGGVDEIAEIFVLGRPLGPILQKTGTSKLERRVSLEAVYPAATTYLEAHPNAPDSVANKDSAEYKNIASFINSFRPILATTYATIVPTSSYHISTVGQVFKVDESKSWNPFEGRFTWDVTWVYNTGDC